jgi:transitional endoplasmic reticulum ATPase
MKLKTNLEKKKLLGDLLGRHESFVMGGEMTKMMSVESYSLDVLNTDIDMRFIMENSRKFLGQMESGQLNKYGFSNLNILLQGPPGTGKTEFVKHYAETLQKELIIKRLSDIRSKWYGESLQNIAHMFEDAQSRNSILFLDEADAFFRNRETANEHYVAETNELLTRMENFKGILVCSTNFYQQMDPATMRRFSYKVRFDYLNEKGKLILFDKVLGELLESPVQEEDLRKLRSLPNLTPGDFKVVFQKNFLMGKRSGTDLIAQLQTEIAYKKDRANIGLA